MSQTVNCQEKVGKYMQMFSTYCKDKNVLVIMNEEEVTFDLVYSLFKKELEKSPDEQLKLDFPNE